MNPKHQRMRFVLVSVLLMGLAAAFILRNFEDSLVFFFTPTQWQEKHASLNNNRPIRIGGLVKVRSVKKSKTSIRFIITDLTHDMPVTYTGLLPTLFREGQGVVAEGVVDAQGTLQASAILAKHDENYMPREVVEQLKASGRWQEYGSAFGAGGASAPATLKRQAVVVSAPRSLRSGSPLDAATHGSSEGGK